MCSHTEQNDKEKIKQKEERKLNRTRGKSPQYRGPADFFSDDLYVFSLFSWFTMSFVFSLTTIE